MCPTLLYKVVHCPCVPLYFTFEILDVLERTHILFHKGNSEHNTQGCVLIAEEFGKLHGKAAVLASGRGFTEFMYILQDVDEFDLIIEDYRCCTT